MKTIVVASTNPAKVNPALEAFLEMFPNETFTVVGVAAPSGVAEQPMTSDETLLGAKNRVTHCAANHPDADYWVGIEGGIHDHGHELTAFAWAIVASRSSIVVGKGSTGEFVLPPEICRLVRSGVPLGQADDTVFSRTGSSRENGAVGLLTGDVLTRASFHKSAVTLALIPFRNPDLFRV